MRSWENNSVKESRRRQPFPLRDQLSPTGDPKAQGFALMGPMNFPGIAKSSLEARKGMEGTSSLSEVRYRGLVAENSVSGLVIGY